MEKFDCLICGSCCRSIGRMVIAAIAALDEADRSGEEVHPILEELAAFPFDINDKGECSKLKGDICLTYDNRPLICRVDSMYERFWSKVMTKDQWYAESKKSCEKLRGKHDRHATNTGPMHSSNPSGLHGDGKTVG